MLQSKAMLANLTIKAWSARKRDREVGKEVETKHGAHDAGNFNKLLIDAVHLKPITSATTKLREAHYAMTLPWGDNGDRLLPAKMFFDYRAKINGLCAEFEAVVDKFCADYPQHRVNARKRLGTMYDPEDYPSESHVRARFAAKPSYVQIPDAKDFRVEVGEEEVDEIRKDIVAQVAARQKAATDDLWARLRDVTERIHERLSNPEAVFRDSLIENARFAASIAGKLNVDDDPKLESVRNDIEHALCPYEPQALRDDPKLRAKVAKAAEMILCRLSTSK